MVLPYDAVSFRGCSPLCRTYPKMRTRLHPSNLTADQAVVDALSWPLDFTPCAGLEPCDGYVVTGPKSRGVIARDASGGEFFLCGDGDIAEVPLVYVSSEGAAGVV